MALSVATGVLTVNTLTINATHSVAGLGFQPKAILIWLSGRSETIDTNGVASHDWGYGLAADNGAGGVNMRALTSQSFNGNTTMGADQVGRNDCVVALLNHALAGGTDNGQIKVNSLDAGGFTVGNLTALNRAVRLSYICYGGADLTNYEIGTITEPGATGNQATVLSGAFQPDALILLAGQIATINTVAVDSSLSFGVASSSTAADQFVSAGSSDDALGTSNTHFYLKTGEVVALYNATPPATIGATTLNGRAALASFDATGFTLNWTERAASRLVFYLALKGGRWKAGKQTLANSANGNTNSVTGLAFQPKVLLAAYGGFAAESTSDTPQAFQEQGMGAATSSSARHAQWAADNDGTTSGSTSTGIGTGAVVKYIDSAGSTNLNCDFTSFNADGYTLTNLAALGLSTAMVGYLVATDNAAGGGASQWGAQMSHTWNRIVQVF